MSVSGLAISSEIPITDSLIELYDAERPRPIGDVAWEMATVVLLRLRVPLDELEDYFLSDRPLPPGAASVGYLTSRSLVGHLSALLKSMPRASQDLIRSTIDAGKPRVFDVVVDDLPAYRALGFVSVATGDAAGPSVPLRIVGPDYDALTYHHRDDLLDAVCRVVDGRGLLARR